MSEANQQPIRVIRAIRGKKSVSKANQQPIRVIRAIRGKKSEQSEPTNLAIKAINQE